MARFYPLFSSSKGNSAYIGNEDSGILIDAGVSCKRLADALSERGIPMSAVRGVFITHIHSDHIAGLKTLTKKYRIPVYAQRVNLEILSSEDKIAVGTELFCMEDGAAAAGDYAVEHFETLHDVPASCGYKVTCPDGKVAVTCTDLGKVTDTVRENLVSADMVLLESNYDVKMLRSGSYPYQLKQRIASSVGHLSNDDCAVQLKDLAASGVCRFVLGHLSQENNTPAVCEQSALSALSGLVRGRDYTLDVAPPCGFSKAVIF